ncbi:RRQRL motif-containing zinc-binding protein [Kitasatospora sp. McL0602]|uniref:RRQRL motif-containing zinc-binding protein n=1 Tax=Kitasatospora sp. McL0602 TaxID=3439530 RepID=UPI003F891BA4
MSGPRFFDPDGHRHGGTPTYPYKLAPDGLLTYRQLRAIGLRPGGQPVAAQILWRSRLCKTGPRAAYLYRRELALPVRPMTPARWVAVHAANRARRTCPACRRDAGYVLPRHLGTCLPCSELPERDADMSDHTVNGGYGHEPRPTPPPQPAEPSPGKGV